MINAIIYTTLTCPFCVYAKKLLDSKGIKYTEVRVDVNPDKFQEMMEQTEGRRTVPQIFIASQHIGGFDDLKLFIDQGKLMTLLSPS